MTGVLEVVEKENKTFDSLDGVIRVGNTNVVRFDKYLKDGYTAAYWRANPAKTKASYIDLLTRFYTELMTGNYKPSENKEFEPGMLLAYGPGSEKRFPVIKLKLDDLVNWEMMLTRQPHYSDFVLLRVNTPYADFALECMSGNEWSPQEGTVGVISNQPLGMPLARFVANSSRYQVNAEEIRPLLDRAFTF